MTSRLAALLITAISALTGSAAAVPADGAPPPADLIVVNADVYTSDAARPRAEAFAVSRGRIVMVGDGSTVRRSAGPDTSIIDAGGRTITPGFIDGH